MTKLLFFTLCVLNLLSVNAQSGYCYGDKFIELKPKANVTPYIIPSSSPVSQQNNAPLKGGYTSLIYQTENVESIVVLPKIILEVLASGDIDRIMSDYKSILKVLNKHDNIYYLDCDVKTSEEILALVKNLSKEKCVKWCEPDMYSGENTNNNPYYGSQWYLKNNSYYGGLDINVESAWQLIKGKNTVTVSVLDTGVDLQHEDLANSLLQGMTVGDSIGYGAPKNWTKSDSKGHGTCCAGIIGAIDNNVGIMGVASGIRILPVNIAPYPCSSENQYGFASHFEKAQAILWAYPKSDILSCSWKCGPSKMIEYAITEARKKGRNGKGTIVVFAAGNDTSAVAFPGTVDGVLTVGAIERNGSKCTFSNTGSSLDLVAFGWDITTTDVTGSLGYTANGYFWGFNGTSAACPQVAGVAALMLSANPNLSEETVKQYLKETARDLGEKGRDDLYGYGLIDAQKAVAQALKGTMYITGPANVDTKAIYHIKNLPSGCTVSWSQESNSTVLPSSTYMEVGKPTENAVTVYNKTGFAIKLIATIHFPDDVVTPEVLSLTISGAAPTLSGLYYEVLSDGSKTYEMSLVDDVDGDVNYATPPNEVVITSNCFVNGDVYYYNSSESWNRHYVQVRGDQILFEMPSLDSGQTLNFSVVENGTTLYTFKFMANEAMAYKVPISIVETSHNSYQINLNDDLLKLGTTKTKEVVVVDMVKSNALLKEKISGDSHLLDLNHLGKGIYAIQVNIGNKTYSKKIVVDK